jgi:hypothetical protein
VLTASSPAIAARKSVLIQTDRKDIKLFRVGAHMTVRKVVPQHINFRNLDCQTAASTTTSAKAFCIKEKRPPWQAASLAVELSLLDT